MMMLAFAFTWFSLVAAPLMSGLAAWRLMNSSGTWLRRGSTLSGGFFLLVFLCWAAGLQWSSVILNFAFCLAALYCWWFIAAAAWAVRPPFLRILAILIGYLPLIPSLLLGTVGTLGLAFILGDYLEPPIDEQRLDRNHTCRITGWGAAFSDSGYTVHLYRSPIWFPLIRYEVASETVDETDPGDGPEHSDCGTVARNLARRPNPSG
jgi:hypothetical protein